MNKVLCGAAVVASLSLASVALAPANGEALALTRSVRLLDANGTNVGAVTFWPAAHDKVLVHAKISDAEPGFHGIHVHANDQHLGCVAPGFTSVGGHFVMPGDGTHGAHSGDMPNVLVNEDGAGQLWFLADAFTLRELDGRAVILHAGADNHGNVPVGSDASSYTANSPDAVSLTQKTGNAGARVACGVIGVGR